MNEEQEQKNHDRAQTLLSEQRFTVAVIAGAVAVLLAAIAYGLIVAWWPFSYGFAAAGIGTVVGLTIGFLGRGISVKFAALAVVYTTAGCVLGNLFAAITERVIATAESPIEILKDYPLSAPAEWSVSGLSPIFIVYWFVAVLAAAFFARRPLSRSDRLAIGLYEARM